MAELDIGDLDDEDFYEEIIRELEHYDGYFVRVDIEGDIHYE